MEGQTRAWLKRVAWIAVIAVLAGLLAWELFLRDKVESTIIAGDNGRIEATEIDVAAKLAGRIKAILVEEGDFVTAGQLVAQTDTEAPQAQLRQTEAQERQAQNGVATARSRLAQAILYRGAGFRIVWPQFAALAFIGAILFGLSLCRFLKALGSMA